MDSRTKARVSEITKDTMAVFTKQYASSFKTCLIEDAKQKRINDAIAEAKASRKASKLVEPVRPRKQRDGAQKLSAKITSYWKLDEDVDPYVVYTVYATLGNRTVYVYKRYKQFKSLHSKFKAKGVEFPKPSSKFGKRNLDDEFLRKRVDVLSGYLNHLCEDENVSKNKDFLAWLGFEKDAFWTRVFEKAFYKTRCYLWQWRTIVYDKEEEGVAGLVVEEVRRELWSDITSKLPSVSLLRKTALQGIYKTIKATIGPVVQTGYAAVRKSMEGLKPTLEKTISEQASPLFDQESKMKETIGDKMKDAMGPVIAGIKDLIGPFAAQILPKITGAVGANFGDSQRSNVHNAIMNVAEKDDDSKLKEVEEEHKGLRPKIKEHINKEVQGALEPLIGDFSSKVKVDALLGMFGPFKKFDRVFGYFLDFADLGNQFHVMREMLKWKKKVKADVLTTEKLNDMLDDEEWDIDYWAIWRSCSYMRWDGYRVAWWLWDWDYAAVSNTFYHFVDDMVEVNRKAMKRLSWKFGDYLWDKSVKGIEGKEAWGKAADECFVIAYDRALSYFKKGALKAIVTNLKRVLNGLIFGKIEKFIMDTLKAVLEPLQDLLGPFKEILDVFAMASEVISKTLDDVVNEILSAIHPVLADGIQLLKGAAVVAVSGVAAVATVAVTTVADNNNNNNNNNNSNNNTGMEGQMNNLSVNNDTSNNASAPPVDNNNASAPPVDNNNNASAPPVDNNASVPVENQ